MKKSTSNALIKKYSRISKYAKIALATVFVYGAGQISVLAAFSAVGIDSLNDAEAHTLPVLIIYILGGITMIASLYAVISFIGYDIRKIINFKRPSWKDLVYVALGYGVYYLLLFIVFGILGTIFPDTALNQKQELGISQNLTTIEMIAAYFAFAVLPPLSEELLFRGFLYGRLLKTKIRPIVSAVFVSVLFGLVHRQLNVGIDTFLLSMVIIYTLNLRNRNIWVAIGIHCLKNTIAYVGLFVFKINIG